MIKQIIVFLMIFLIGTNSNLISYAETNNIEKINNTIVHNTSNQNNIEVSNQWIASIFIPGLGQMLMGEIGKGLLFLVGTISSFFVVTLLSMFIVIDKTGHSNINTIFGIIGSLLFHTWNILDANSLAVSKSINKKNSYSLNPNIEIIKYSFNF